MCTSFTYQMKSGSNALARTMDFIFELDPDAIFVPRNYSWNSIANSATYQTKYAFVGLAKTSKQILLADGVNEKGLACAALYFPGFASYRQQAKEGKTNLAPHEVIFWMLSNFESVASLRKSLHEINIVNIVWEVVGIAPPLHWIITDQTGACIVVEPYQNTLNVFENPIGVMTNSPDFSWHMTNIRNYIGIHPSQIKPITINNVEFAPFGQGAGTVGLPGDYTPPSRFIRALFGKETINIAENDADAATAVFHILSSVDIPKGSVTTEGQSDYTQYSCCMFCETGTYYFKTYDNSQLIKLDLFQEDLNAKEIKIWNIPSSQSFCKLN